MRLYLSIRLNSEFTTEQDRSCCWCRCKTLICLLNLDEHDIYRTLNMMTLAPIKASSDGTTTNSADIIGMQCATFKDILSVDGVMNTLTYHPANQVIPLNEAQKRLFYCMFFNINRKKSIIATVWHENHLRIGDNNYHQLIFQSRALLKRYGLSEKLLITVPCYGIRFNTKLMEEIARHDLAR